ncbi:hypothetical protein FB446DRAFT_403296 [Lentinula raphanica]|nr:hypothetical protein FB446DRAFT_403296 [Lentinula raphanica]
MHIFSHCKHGKQLLCTFPDSASFCFLVKRREQKNDRVSESTMLLRLSSIQNLSFSRTNTRPIPRTTMRWLRRYYDFRFRDSLVIKQQLLQQNLFFALLNWHFFFQSWLTELSSVIFPSAWSKNKSLLETNEGTEWFVLRSRLIAATSESFALFCSARLIRTYLLTSSHSAIPSYTIWSWYSSTAIIPSSETECCSCIPFPSHLSSAFEAPKQNLQSTKVYKNSKNSIRPCKGQCS